MGKAQERKGADLGEHAAGKHASGTMPGGPDVEIWYQPESGVPRDEDERPSVPLSEDD